MKGMLWYNMSHEQKQACYLRRIEEWEHAFALAEGRAKGAKGDVLALVRMQLT